MSLSRRFSCASVAFFSGQVVRRRLRSRRRGRWLKARICASACDSRSQHAVEALRQPPDLVDGVDGDAARQVAALDVAHRAASASSGRPMIRCVIEPDTSVSTTTTAMRSDRDLLLGLQERFDLAQRPLHHQRRLPRPGRSTGSSIGSSCAGPATTP
jgi:hypothetical protein